MKLQLLMLIVLIVTGVEIFFNVFTNLFSKMFFLKKDFEFSQKTKENIKVIVVLVFMISVIYYLIQFVKISAAWFGIPLDKSILDFFK